MKKLQNSGAVESYINGEIGKYEFFKIIDGLVEESDNFKHIERWANSIGIECVDELLCYVLNHKLYNYEMYSEEYDCMIGFNSLDYIISKNK